MIEGGAPMPCNDTMSGAGLFLETFDDLYRQYGTSMLAPSR